MRTVLIVGGHSAHGFDRKADKKGFQVLFHPAYNKKKNEIRHFESLIRMADCVVLLLDACSHNAMWTVKELAKTYEKPVVYQKGLGVS